MTEPPKNPEVSGAPSDWNERYSRQVILPGVGPEGQKKWGQASILLAGEGPALQAALTAFSSTGVNKLFILPVADQGAFPSFQASGRQMRVLPPSLENLPETLMTLVLSEDAKFRREANRLFRKNPRPVLFGWAAGSGMALFLQNSKVGGACPCFECFEALNPKAFSKGNSATSRFLGASAASEALQFILSGESPLLGKVWVTSLSEGVSFMHEVQPTPKCAAKLLEEGAFYTP